MIVSKDKKKFKAEVKSGKAASIETINNRRQLLEYTKLEKYSVSSDTASGDIESRDSIVLLSNGFDETIYYTLDNTDPTDQSSVFNNSLKILSFEIFLIPSKFNLIASIVVGSTLLIYSKENLINRIILK